ncbi:MAG: hypothetical protein WBF32_04535 [Candidatus Aminicenantaceae bacterium]
MRTKLILLVIVFLYLITGVWTAEGPQDQSKDAVNAFLKKQFDLAVERVSQKQYYCMETKIVHFSLDGKRTKVDTLNLWLEYVPVALSGEKEDRYICRMFIVQKGTEPPVSIPILKDWSYKFIWGTDEAGRVFGIDHGRFENLKTDKGDILPPVASYFVYNTFIDFHGFCDIFATRTEGGKGIQDLSFIGDKIIHAASNTEPPVNLGSNVAEGSTFKNGEVTLEFKGISSVDERLCSLVAFDSGESSFNMIMQPTPKMQIKTVGSSHYKGDLYIDLESYWVRKVVMDEVVISETILPMPPHKVNAVIERITTIRNVSQVEFLQR